MILPLTELAQCLTSTGAGAVCGVRSLGHGCWDSNALLSIGGGVGGERNADSALLTTGAVYIDQYCNPLSDISLRDIQAQIHSIVELVCKTLRGINGRHPSLTFRAGMELLGLGWAAGALGVVSYLMM